MAEERAFDTLDVLSAITGRLVSPRRIDGVYEVLNYMTGESLFTHQLPRVGEEARALMVQWQPMLAEAVKEAEQVTPDNWQQWARTWVKRYGTKLMVPRMTAEQHKSVGPMEELAQLRPDLKPIVVVDHG